ncbi:MAG: NfuA family Fe-S biogenesis protein [Xanthomonadales bacterium]|nr:NfuA family Fe-S biogenesis protein [Xanthomonadales bacterium]NIX12001.1 NfuA family Fe-S biogenesis protein [Xanthomonadales bacterium]
MIEISSTAQRYFKRLIEQQEEPGLGLRIRVVDPGTPRASCDLQFCRSGDEHESDLAVEFPAFSMFVARDSVEWLSEAEIDFEESPAGGQLSIRAPNIKGHMPGEDAELAERVAWVLETEVNPGLASHGGMCALEEITGDGEVVLRFGGGCHGCGMVDVTLKEGIEKTLKAHFPEISGVVDATDHSAGENPYYS